MHFGRGRVVKAASFPVGFKQECVSQLDDDQNSKDARFLYLSCRDKVLVIIALNRSTEPCYYIIYSHFRNYIKSLRVPRR